MSLTGATLDTTDLATGIGGLITLMGQQVSSNMEFIMYALGGTLAIGFVYFLVRSVWRIIRG